MGNLHFLGRKKTHMFIIVAFIIFKVHSSSYLVNCHPMQRGKMVGIAKETIYNDFMHTFYIHIQLTTTLDVDHPKTF